MLGSFSVAPGRGRLPKALYSQYPAPGTYSTRATPTGYCTKDCVVLQLDDDSLLRVEDPRGLVKNLVAGEALLAVDTFNRPTLVRWKED
ncbi:MAG: hypothetical protein EA343_20635 [Nodularia sp. (in: Bacteria)]|nr:MAG: hypothetical protein EA343_20635 [Nodularia sp. (in: cyanobacteria)]